MRMLREIMEFSWRYKQFWMAPTIILLLIIGVLVFLTTVTASNPFVYTLF